MALTEKNLLDVTNLTVSYDRHPALHHISCQFTEGGLYAITGPNGGGKSTFLKILAGIMRANQGGLAWQGNRPRAVAWLPQQTPMMRQFPLSVLEVVAMGHWPHITWYKKITAQQLDEAVQALPKLVCRASSDARSKACRLVKPSVCYLPV